MLKRMASILVLGAGLALPSLAAAGPWAFVATDMSGPVDGSPTYIDERGAIFSVDLGTTPPRFFGPFLQGQLGTPGGGLFDVAMLPNGRELLVSNFGDMKVFRVNVANPKFPWVSGELTMEYDTGTLDTFGDPIIYSFFAEDIAVSPDGRWAAVTDGGFSSYIGFIDLATFTLKSIQKLEVPNPLDPLTPIPLYAQAVAIAPNGRDVLFVDYFGRSIGFGRVNAARNRIPTLTSLYLCDNVDPLDVDPSDGITCLGNVGYPVNVTISPDGRTALVALASTTFDPAGADTPTSAVAALRIRTGGSVVPGNPFFVTGLPSPDALTEPNTSPGGNQSIAFTPGGLNAFVITQPNGLVQDPDYPDDPTMLTTELNELAKLKILGPGRAVVKTEPYAQLGGRGTSQLFGVDTLAISRRGGWILGSNPTKSGAEPVLTAVNYITGKKYTIKLPDEAVPCGVAFKR